MGVNRQMCCALYARGNCVNEEMRSVQYKLWVIVKIKKCVAQ